MDSFYDTALRMHKSSEILLANNEYHNSCYLAGYVVECYMKILLYNVSNNSAPPYTHNLNNLSSTIIRYLSSGNSSLNLYFSNNLFNNIISDWNPGSKRYIEQSLEWIDVNARDYQNEVTTAMSTLAQMRIDGHILI